MKKTVGYLSKLGDKEIRPKSEILPLKSSALESMHFLNLSINKKT